MEERKEGGREGGIKGRREKEMGKEEGEREGREEKGESFISNVTCLRIKTQLNCSGTRYITYALIYACRPMERS